MRDKEKLADFVASIARDCVEAEIEMTLQHNEADPLTTADFITDLAMMFQRMSSGEIEIPGGLGLTPGQFAAWKEETKEENNNG